MIESALALFLSKSCLSSSSSHSLNGGVWVVVVVSATSVSITDVFLGVGVSCVGG